MTEKTREAANWALTMFLLTAVYALNAEVSRLKGIIEYLHGPDIAALARK